MSLIIIPLLPCVSSSSPISRSYVDGRFIITDLEVKFPLRSTAEGVERGVCLPFASYRSIRIDRLPVTVFSTTLQIWVSLVASNVL